MATTSDTINELATALAKAQGDITGASKDKTNPHFKSAYADLASVWDACRMALSKNGIAVIQCPSASGATVTVTTILTHASGQRIESSLEMTATQNTPQGIGSAITYARRYALASMVGVAPEDDDGNAASAKTNGPAEPPKPTAPDGFDDWLRMLQGVALQGSDALKAAWEDSSIVMRRFMTSNAKHIWDGLKLKAAQNEPGDDKLRGAL